MSEEKALKPVPVADNTFDIADLATGETADMAIVTSSGAPTTWVWTIAGPGHPAAVKADREASDEARREELAKEKARINGRKWTPEFVDSADQQRRNAAYFAKKVLGWTPVRINGAEFPYSPSNVTKILLDPNYQIVYRQLLDFLTDERSFMKPSLKN